MSGVTMERLGADDPVALGRYQLIGRLGSGGMGRIYLARSTDGRIVAVKTLLAEGLIGDTDRRRFSREVKLAQRVDSGYTARVVDADAQALRPWMAIEYIAAPSLAELVREAGRLPAPAVRWVGAGVAAALVALHREGVVHRDIKPANVLLPMNGPRVIDFGISHANDITRTSLTLGTIAYTSPEQARGEASTTASDVYSLGATLFQLAVGRPPYTDDGDTLRLLARVSRAELDLDGLPPELEELIRPCLSGDPENRPSPADVLDQFASGLAEPPVPNNGNNWLPPHWTALIHAYDQQGQALRRSTGDGISDAPTVDGHTQAVPAAGLQRRDQERLRGTREGRRAAAADSSRAADTHPPTAIAAGNLSATGAGPAAGQGAGPAAGPGAGYGAGHAGGTARSHWKVWSAAPLICALLLFFWQPWSSDEPNGPGRSGNDSAAPGTGSSAPSSYSAPAQSPLTTADITFRALKAGDCVSSHDDGFGEWNDAVPNRVACDAADAYNVVVSASRVSGASCDEMAGQQARRNVANDRLVDTLCLDRKYHVGECFPAQTEKEGGEGRVRTVWDCADGNVPDKYTYLMQITDYRKKPVDMDSFSCARNGADRARYFTWEVSGGKNIVCAKVLKP